MSKPKGPGAAQAGTSEPFFARYLEGQQESGARNSANVGDRKSLAYKKATTKKATTKKAGAGTLQTLKFPSDSDELVYRPYYQKAADVPKGPGGGAVTLKFPSDSDEDTYNAHYLSLTDVPKGKVKAKGGTIQLRKAK